MKGRKWFIAIIIILIIAAILTVVFINLFRDKDTKQTINNVHHYVQEGYLNSENHENERFKQYAKLIVTLAQTQETQEIKQEDRNIAANALEFFEAMEIYGKFIDNEIVYTKYTEVYRINRKSISDSLSDAQRYTNTLTAYLDKHLDNILASPDEKVKNSWLSQSWKDCKQYIENITKKSLNALSKLGEVYTSCVTSPLMNNKLTQAIFMATKTLAENVKLEVSNSTKSFKDMANAYLKEDKISIILGVQYNEDLQAKLDKILGENGQETDEYNKLLAGTLVG